MRGCHGKDNYHATAGARTRQIRGLVGRQPGDPQRAAAAIVQAVESPGPFLRLLLGRHALKTARLNLAAAQKDFDAWAEVSEGADFPEQLQPGP